PLNVEAMERATDTTGMLLSTFGIVALIVFLTPLNRIYDAFSAIKLITIGLSCIGIGMFMLGIYANFYVNFFAMIFEGFGFVFICLSINKVFAVAASKVVLGLAFGLFYAFFSFVVVIGSFGSGLFAGILGFPFILRALLMFISVAIITLILKKRTSAV